MARRRYQRGWLSKRGTRNPVWVGGWREYAKDSSGKQIITNRKEILGPQSMTRKLALRALEERLQKINAENVVERKLITFGEFADKWESMVLPQYKLSTQRESKNVLKARLRAEFSKELLKSMTTERIQRWTSSLSISPKTLHNFVAVLRGMWRTAKAWDYVTHDPFKALSLPRIIKQEARCFTLDEVQRIIAAAKEPYRTFYWLAAETGMRAGELCGLRVEDFNGAENIVFVRQSAWRGRLQSPKTKAGQRTCSISRELSKRLAEHINNSLPNDLRLLFPTREGRPWNGNKINQHHLQPLLVRLSIPRRGLHAFRHFHATELDRRGVPMRSQILRMGHTRATTTLGYGRHVDADAIAFSSQLGSDLLPIAPEIANGLTLEKSEAASIQ